MEIKPIKPKELKRVSANSALERRLSGFVACINDKLIGSYSEGDNWQFAYATFPVEELDIRERLKLQKLFRGAGYDVSFDSGVAYDESPTQIVVQYDTRHH